MPINKIKLPDGTVVDIEDSKIFRGTCSTAAATYTKTVVCPEFTANDLVAGVLVLVKFDYTNTRTGTSVKLNVNNTGAYTVYSFSSGSRSGLASAATMNAEFPNLFVFCGDSWQILCYNTNTTYTAMTQAEIDAGTQTGARLISPKLLRNNFFTDDDVDSTPTANSTNLVTSGGVYNAIPSVSGKEDTANKVTSLSSSSTDTEYPSAKCIYDIVGDIETLINAL